MSSDKNHMWSISFDDGSIMPLVQAVIDFTRRFPDTEFHCLEFDVPGINGNILFMSIDPMEEEEAFAIFDREYVL